MLKFARKRKNEVIVEVENMNNGIPEMTAGTEEKNDEIIAVIAAAIAAMGSRPGYKLEVKSIRRTPHSSPVWNTTGRLERLSRNLGNG